MKEKTGKILIVDDNEDVLLSLNMLLRPWVEAVRVITSPERIPEMMAKFQPDVILLDMNFSRDAESGEEGYQWLDHILKLDADSVVLFITAYVTTEKTVRAIRAGAVDFIPKPWDKQRLVEAVQSAVLLRQEKKERKVSHNSEAKRQCPPTRESAAPVQSDKMSFIGESSVILALKRQIEQVAQTDANVLITGENGSGKDVVAHELHRLSARASRPMVGIDLGCIPETLFESELFGYEKGAFTGADTTKEGRMETADGGTLFLDEIGNLPLAMQQKLLTVIEKRQTSRIGSNTMRQIDVRIVAATHADLPARVADGSFRQDLLYRLNTIELHLPPLRERGNDILLLAQHFLDRFSDKYRRPQRLLAAEERERLMQHAWPGNVRELQHVMERAVVMNSEATPSEAALQPEQGPVHTLNLEELERQAILRALQQADGNLSQAAVLLGITRYALYRKINKLGL